jgi:60 kDa SS-A/Ro ribonucleoprotein
MRYNKHYQTRVTPQSEPIPGSNQVRNSAGGYSWAVDDWKRLDRFLILGSEGGSYYASERKLTVENAQAVERCIREDGKRVVSRIVEISMAGRAPKNSPALFALAMVIGMGDKEAQKAGMEAIPKVARIGTHLFELVEYIQSFRGWGRGLRRAIGNWYNQKEPDSLVYQLLKYRQREGWSHKDVLRLSHPKPVDKVHDCLFRYVISSDLGEREVRRKDKVMKYPALPVELLPPLVKDFEEVQKATDEGKVIELVKKNRSITWEMIPTQFLASPNVWKALLPHLPMTALLRNLGRMTSNGTLKPLSDELNLVCSKLTNEEFVRKARIHPLSVLVSLKTYASGGGVKGSLKWDPISQVVDALDKAFYLAFGNVVPTGKRWVLGLDVSGSMEGSNIAGMIGITPRVGSAAMALVTASTEPNYTIMAFSSEFVPVSISPRERLDSVIHKISRISFGNTDCAIPMIWALSHKIQADIFVIYTDSETWYGKMHPAQALQEYRRKMGIPAKLVVVGMVSNGFSIADPNDSGMLDVVGFDTATPSLISDFASDFAVENI